MSAHILRLRIQPSFKQFTCLYMNNAYTIFCTCVSDYIQFLRSLIKSDAYYYFFNDFRISNGV